MKIIAFSEFRKLNNNDLDEMLPLLVTFNGIPVGIMGKIEETISLGDMHPRVRQQFKAREAQIRLGMPPAEKVDAPISRI